MLFTTVIMTVTSWIWNAGVFVYNRIYTIVDGLRVSVCRHKSGLYLYADL